MTLTVCASLNNKEKKTHNINYEELQFDSFWEEGQIIVRVYLTVM